MFKARKDRQDGYRERRFEKPGSVIFLHELVQSLFDNRKSFATGWLTVSSRATLDSPVWRGSETPYERAQS